MSRRDIDPDEELETTVTGKSGLFLASRIVFFFGGLVFFASTFLNWEGSEIFRGNQVVRRGTFNAYQAVEEVKATVALYFLAMILGACTIKNKKTWPFLLAISLEIAAMIAVLVLISVHESSFLSVRNFGNGTYSVVLRVLGPYVGMGAAVLILVGSGLKFLNVWLSGSGRKLELARDDEFNRNKRKKPVRQDDDDLDEDLDDEERSPRWRSRSQKESREVDRGRSRKGPRRNERI